MRVIRSASFNRHLGLCSLFILLDLLVIASCGRRDSSGMVIRTSVGDTLFVTTNPPTESTPLLFSLERNLVIGVAEGDEPYMLIGINSAAEDDAGRIYITNQRDGEVRVFDSEGTFILRFGRRGEGPGEFNSNFWGQFNVYPCGESYLAVEDMPCLRVFDRTGRYMRSFDFRSFITSAHISGRASRGIRWNPDLQKLVTTWSRSEPGPLGERELRLLIIDEEMTVPRWLPTAWEPKGLYMDESGYGLSIPFTPSYSWAFTGKHTLVWGLSDQYRLNLYDMEEDEWTAVVLDYDPEPVTSGDIEAFKERFLSVGSDEELRKIYEPILHRMTYPKYKPFFNELLGDDQGRIWVLRSLTSWEAGPPDIYQYDLFGNSGEWLGSVESPGELLHVRGDHVYMIGGTEHPTLERHKLIPSG